MAGVLCICKAGHIMIIGKYFPSIIFLRGYFLTTSHDFVELKNHNFAKLSTLMQHVTSFLFATTPCYFVTACILLSGAFQIVTVSFMISSLYLTLAPAANKRIKSYKDNKEPRKGLILKSSLLLKWNHISKKFNYFLSQGFIRISSFKDSI